MAIVPHMQTAMITHCQNTVSKLSILYIDTDNTLLKHCQCTVNTLY